MPPAAAHGTVTWCRHGWCVPVEWWWAQSEACGWAGVSPGYGGGGGGYAGGGGGPGGFNNQSWRSGDWECPKCEVPPTLLALVARSGIPMLVCTASTPGADEGTETETPALKLVRVAVSRCRSHNFQSRDRCYSCYTDKPGALLLHYYIGFQGFRISRAAPFLCKLPAGTFAGAGAQQLQQPHMVGIGASRG